jgi:hypothetical protein
MLDLLYTGHPQEARDFLNKIWPEGEEIKELFLIEFKQKLNSSKDWQKIKDTLYQTLEEKVLWTAEVGTIKITSIPEGTYVLLDGDNKGKTPIILNNVLLGKHKIILDRSGYEDWEEKVFLSSVQMKEINVRLIVKTGDAVVKVWPTPDETKEAKVYLDGKYIGQGFCLIADVSPGEHIIKVTKPGYEMWKNPISFYPGETHIVMVDLKATGNRELSIEINSLILPLLVLIGLILLTVIFLFYKNFQRKRKNLNK